jgi:hypothetical protein
MPTINEPQNGDTVDPSDVPIHVKTAGEDAWCCIFITEPGNPNSVLAGPFNRQASGNVLQTDLDIGDDVSGNVDLYVCESAGEGCDPKPDPQQCPHVSIDVEKGGE